ncbi:thiamine pyrophosphate-dependent dehydrogenase E1 component subunit alpha [Natrinema halophilum]|uniref:thiamine pyrophosphate-dependent dehydrogenase E1 component subunit alpha n=1 Tax=Natrinema halophilum TaxID=1699371 RepID=UPI001F425656|nr:thiamine pyrophosphate-dependent enzyme [Natrinema halophilum]UHQ96322.1 pyruvate dehydrogenase (acetyl-transferring) E1 component subunit alpha [Natrinema halophilum]
MSTWSEVTPLEDFRQILTKDGTLQREPPDLDEEILLEAYITFIKTRKFDEKRMRMQRRGEVHHASRTLGEEAVAIGSAIAMEPDDWSFPSYRQTGALLYWGVPMAGMFAGSLGAEPETIDEYLSVDANPSVNVVSTGPPLTVNVTNAVGSGMVDALSGSDKVTLTFLGDGSTSQGDFHDAMNFAGVFDVPTVIICQNNQWAISVPRYRQTGSETIAQKGEAYGIPHERVDGNDIFAVYETVQEAVDHARDGGGPTFIEAVTYRRREHNTSDDERVYRDNDEMREYWEERDPLDRFEKYLEREGMLDEDRKAEIEQAVEQEITEALELAREVPTSDPQRMFDSHIRGDSWNMRQQRAELSAELDGRNPFVDVQEGDHE